MKTLLFSLSVSATLAISPIMATDYASWGGEAGFNPGRTTSINWSDAVNWNRTKAESAGWDANANIIDPLLRTLPDNDFTVRIKLQNVTMNVDVDTLNLKEITGVYSATLIVDGAGKTINLTNGYGSDGNGSVFSILNGAKVIAGGNVNASKNSTINLMGTSDNRSALTAANIYASGDDGGGGVFNAEYADITGKFNAQRRSVVSWNYVALVGGLEINAGTATYTNTFTANNSTVNGRFWSGEYGSATFNNSTITTASGAGNFDVGKGSTITFNNTNWRNETGGMNLNATNAADSPQTVVKISGNSYLWFGDNLNLNAGTPAGGSNTVLIDGNGATLSVKRFEVSSNGRTSGDFMVHVTGQNNLFEVREGNVNIDGYINNGTTPPTVSGGTVGVLIEGEGNSFYSKSRVTLGNQDGNGIMTGGGSYFKVSSANADNKSKINVGTFNIARGTTVGDVESTYSSILEFGGNTILRNFDGTGGTAINLGSKGTSGTASLIVKGDNNDLLLSTLNIAQTDGSLGGKVIADISGSNNVIKIKNTEGVRMLDVANTSGGEADFILGGSGNLVEIDVNSANNNGLRIADNGSMTGGVANFVVEGSNNQFVLKNSGAGRADLIVRKADNSTGGDANIVLRGTGNLFSVAGHTSIGNSNNASGGVGTFTIEGFGNTFETNNLVVGAGTNVSNGAGGKFIVKGGGNTITVNGNIDSWSSGSDFETASGGFFIFEVDDTGISTINVTGNANIGAIVLLDFSVLDSAFDGEKFDFISAGGSLNIGQVYIKLHDGIIFKVSKDGVYGDENEMIMVSWDNVNGLWAEYTYLIPEPSTYAAIFGAIALAFAAYRRKRSQ